MSRGAFRKARRKVEAAQRSDAVGVERLAARLLENPSADRAAVKKLRRSGYTDAEIREEYLRIGVSVEAVDVMLGSDGS